jgi:peptidyl-prolyl cis-trans isomerase SurA
MRYFLLFVGLTQLPLAFSGDVTVVEEIVCKVNGDIITRGELEKDRRDIETEFRQQGLTSRALQDAVNGRARDVLRERIDRLLLVQQGKELDIKVDNDLTKQMANIQRQSGISDPEQFQAYVREKTGQPYEDYKNEMKNKLLIDRVIRQEVSSNIKFTRADLEQYYNSHQADFQREERVFLADIYVSTAGKDAAGAVAAERKARDLVVRARKGEKFSEMAQTNSDDANAQNGGEMPPMKKEDLRKEIQDAVWAQPRGYVSEALKLDNGGFYIFKVEDHQKAGLAEFEEVRNEVENRLYGPKMDPAIRTYLTKIRANAFLEIKPGYEDSGAAPGKNTAWSDPAQLKPETITKEEVAAKTRRKKLLWAIPLPGTSTQSTGTSSSR